MEPGGRGTVTDSDTAGLHTGVNQSELDNA